MRRRDLFLIGATLTLQACSTPGPVPRPSIPPGPTLPTDAPPLPSAPPGADAVPKSFLATPQWPGGKIPANITALHQHHLCAAVIRDEPYSHPVVVDLTGPTTRMVFLDEDDTFTTREVEVDFLAEHTDPNEQNPDLGRPLITGPSIIDDDHAWVIVAHTVGVIPPDAASHATATVHLLKINLTDGVVAASALLCQDFDIQELIMWMSLSFSPDHTSLLVAGSGETEKSEDFIGLRLDTTDLSVQFDAHSVITGTGYVKVAGEALKVHNMTDTLYLVVLADGRKIPNLENPVVIGSWCYHEINAEEQVMLRDLTTGKETPVPDLSPSDLRGLRPGQPKIWSAQHYLGVDSLGKDPGRFSVWRPGESTPVLLLREEENELYEGQVAVHGDALYGTLSNTLEIRSLSSGEVLGSIPWQSPIGGIAVSAWGVAINAHFFPANEWF